LSSARGTGQKNVCPKPSTIFFKGKKSIMRHPMLWLTIDVFGIFHQEILLFSATSFNKRWFWWFGLGKISVVNRKKVA